MAQTKVVNNIVIALTDEEIQEKLKSDKKQAEEFAKIEYIEKRVMAYDPIPEQLDQIYHDIDGWKAKIKAVKDKFPKP
tara:strand:+ start:218 stop:451 length:234 start_codon:yes stop_codon:yes gene_type:complete